MTFDIKYSARALQDLRNIYRYIAAKLLAPETAKEICARIAVAIDGLDVLPCRFPLYDKEPWHSRGLRKLIVGNFIVFYIPMEKLAEVVILAIMYGRRDIANVLEEKDDPMHDDPL